MLPDRLMNEAKPDGAGTFVREDGLKDDFYRVMGCGLDGGNSRETTLKRPGIDRNGRVGRKY